METLPALRITTDAARRLRAARGGGRVHSVFARAVNIELDGAGWLSLHGPGPIPAPFGIACAATPWAPVGARVRLEGARLRVDGVLALHLADAAPCESRLPARASAPLAGLRLASLPLAAAGGLLPIAARVLEGAPAASDPLARLAGPALLALSAATTRGDAGACLGAARRLLGLGPGLTPAGDDCLVGWLAGLRVVGPAGRRLAAAAGPGLVRAAAERTGPLSQAFLGAALAGHVAEPVRAFVARPDGPRLAALLALGATSGADLLAGYLLARAAVSLSAGGGAPLREI